MKKCNQRKRLFVLLGVSVLAALLVACDIVVSINTNGKITFQVGVYDPNHNKLTTVQDKIFFMGGWGKKGAPQNVMDNYAFTLTSSYLNLKNVTLSDGYTSYDAIWNYIPIPNAPNIPGGKTSVLHTDCMLTYHPNKVNPSMTAANGKYRCRIICDSGPPGTGMHKVRITVYTRAWNKSDLAQLNILVEGEQGISIDYISET